MNDLEVKAEHYEALKLECNLMIFHRAECECSDYWARNGMMLIEQILDEAEDKMLDPLEYFANFAAEVHRRHIEDSVIFT